MDCYYEVNNDITIKITNNSSQDLHISFYPNIFITHEIGPYKEKITLEFKDANVKNGDSFLLVIKFRYKVNNFGNQVSIGYGFDLGGIEKIIFSKMDTGELIMEVKNVYGLIIEQFPPRGKSYLLEITDELLGIEGESK